MFTTKEELKRFFREKVKELHPDRGGDRENFLRFLDWYQKKLSTIPEQVEVTIVHNPIPSQNAIYKMEEFTIRELALALPKKIRLPVDERRCPICDGTGSTVAQEKRICKTCSGSGVLRMENGLQELIELRCPNCQGRGYTLTELCPSCFGKGRIREEREILISIPPGLREGDTLFISGSPLGLKYNIYIEVIVKPHPFLRLTKDSLIYTLTLPFYELLLRETIPIETLEGVEEVPTERLRRGGPVIFPRRGPYLGGSDSLERGDLIIELRITFPERINDKAKDCLQRFLEILEGEETWRKEPYQS